ncbi:TRAP transporter, DctM subunit [delta proteobacterium NaphS2]|nr:TRAP transporter, DctM subunit [delta proteobacterium NaphS2]
MSPVATGVIGIGALFMLLASGMPVAFAMGLVGFVGSCYLISMDAGLSIMGIVPYSTTAAYNLSVLPVFILMGQFAMYGGFTKDLYRAAHKWLGHLPGGLAMATIGACAGFSAISGSSVVTAATMGEVALPEMKRYEYAPSLATGSVAAGGGLGILIPPSTIFIIYCILAEESIGKLFAAGILPGLLLTVLLMLSVYVQVRHNPRLAPPIPKVSNREKIGSFKGTWQVLLLFGIVMGGIWTGVFTATEGAAIGASGAFLLAFASRRLSWREFLSSLKQAAQTSAMAFAIVIGAMIFGYFLSVTRLPTELASWMAGLGLPRYLILIVVILTLLLLGCVMESLSMVLLTIPIFLPVIEALGFDTLWFGVLVALVVEMGVITPPVGLNVYVISGVARDVPLEVIFRGIFPFLLAVMICIALMIIFPQLALFLPGIL